MTCAIIQYMLKHDMMYEMGSYVDHLLHDDYDSVTVAVIYRMQH